MGFLDTLVTGIKTATAIVPSAIELVRTFEMPEAAGQGEHKKDAVVGVIKAVLDNIPDEAKAFFGGDKVVQLVGTVVDLVVKFLNAVGIFKK